MDHAAPVHLAHAPCRRSALSRAERDDEILALAVRDGDVVLVGREVLLDAAARQIAADALQSVRRQAHEIGVLGNVAVNLRARRLKARTPVRHGGGRNLHDGESRTHLVGACRRGDGARPQRNGRVEARRAASGRDKERKQEDGAPHLNTISLTGLPAGIIG